MKNHDKTDGLQKSLRAFVERIEVVDYLTETERTKAQQVSLLLSNELRLGGVIPRGPRKQRRKRQIGDEIELADEHLSSETQTVCLMSATTSEDEAYNPEAKQPIEYPTSSTHRDRHQINRGLNAGFARSSNRCTVDMNACSLVTCRDFLIHASEDLDFATFALIWIVFFVGVNHNRPLIGMRKGCRHPFGDEILIDEDRCVVVYNLFRRRSKDDSDSFEVCGRMAVPVGREITDGLLEIARLGTQRSCIAAALRCAKQFSRRSSGLTPTLPRLLASNAIHMARVGLTELESNALRGRVTPPLFGVSAYYPHRVAGIVDAFQYVYRHAVEQWHLPKSMRFELGEIRSIDDGPIYCPVSRGKALVSNYLGAIAAMYQNLSEEFRAKHIIRDPTGLLDALNIHELGSYVLQEVGLGLRPTGDVAQASLVDNKNGGLTKDKSSRLFSERSYSPITRTHEKVLAARYENRALTRKVLANFGISLEWLEQDSGLAMRFAFDRDSNSVLGKRVRGAEFREFTGQLPTLLLGTEEPNWLRKVSTEVLGNLVPRWQSDELHGHKIVGRQPFGPWSTTSMPEFDRLASSLDVLHKELVPTSLQHPIAAAGKTNPT